jgi:putative ABC transport system permease protein
MIRLFLKGLAAHARAGRVLFLLTLLGVALGVASVLSIRILNLNALAAFEGSLRAVSGEAHLTVRPRGPALDESVYPGLLGTEGVEAAWPLWRLDVALSGQDGVFLDVVGLDLFGGVRLPWQVAPADIARAVDTAGWVAVMPSLASRLGWSVGDVFEVSSGSRRARLQVGAIVDFRRVSPLATERMIVMDIAQAQSLLGRRGTITQVDVRAAEGVDRAALARRLAETAGPRAEVVTPEQRRDEAAGLLAAFRLNLTALSFISLFVGAFLVYSSTQAALVRRRAEFGVLRSLGATTGQVLCLVLGEVALLALPGVALGIPLGYAAARASVRGVSATLTQLYLLEEIETLTLPPSAVAVALAVGLGGALAGAVIPAFDIGRRGPRDLLAAWTWHERVSGASGRLFSAGAAVLGLALLWFAALGRDVRPAGFVLGVALLLALPLMSPWLVRCAASHLRVRSFGLMYALRSLSQRLGITSVTVAALAVAVSMLVGITLMVSGFRRTLEIWVDATVRADVYVTTSSYARARGEAALEPDTIARLGEHPAVRGMDRLRHLFAEVEGRRAAILGVDMALEGAPGRFSLIEGQPRRLREQTIDGAVLIGEPLARRLRVGAGGRITVAGDMVFDVAGVYHDYGSEAGSVAMDLGTMARRFGPGPISSVALYLEPGISAAQVVDDLKGSFTATPLVIRSNRELREQVMRVFDQTFAVTRLLQVMSLLIAVSGITLALLVLARERLPELALHRALGAAPIQVACVFLGKGLGLALFGMILGTVGGVGLAFILVYLINRAYFGWTIALHPPAGDLALQAIVLLAAATVASLYPAWRAGRTSAVELSRDDL